MTRFVDEYLPSCVAGYPVYASPRFSTDIIVVDSGREQVNQRWMHPLHRYTIPEAVRTMSVFNAVRAHWLVMRGPAKLWPWRDPFDFASIDIEQPAVAPVISALDQQIGVGDGVTTQFQITRTYTVGSSSYSRDIYLPIVSSVVVAVNGIIASSGWSVDRESGVITFDSPPPTTEIVTCGFYFDVSVRFEADDSFDAICQAFGIGGYADMTLIETRIC